MREQTIGERIAQDDGSRKYVVNFFGWCHDPANKHDKIWGWVTLGKGSEVKLYNFWGRRGKQMTFKRHESEWGSTGLHKITQQKCRQRPSGQYVSVPIDKIEEVYPDFYNQFEKQLVLAKLFDRIRGEGEYGRKDDE